MRSFLAQFLFYFFAFVRVATVNVIPLNLVHHIWHRQIGKANKKCNTEHMLNVCVCVRALRESIHSYEA